MDQKKGPHVLRRRPKYLAGLGMGGESRQSDVQLPDGRKVPENEKKRPVGAAFNPLGAERFSPACYSSVLAQLVTNVGEAAVEGRADRVDGADDDDRNATHDETVFDRSRARLIP